MAYKHLQEYQWLFWQILIILG